MANSYISYMNVLRSGFSALMNAMHTPNPVVEVYGAKEAKKRLYNARVDVEKLDVGIYTDKEREALMRTFWDEINMMIHNLSVLDLSQCVQSVEEPLRPEWWMLANHLKKRMNDLQGLLGMYGKNVKETSVSENNKNKLNLTGCRCMLKRMVKLGLLFQEGEEFKINPDAEIKKVAIGLDVVFGGGFCDNNNKYKRGKTNWKIIKEYFETETNFSVYVGRATKLRE